MSVSVRPMTQLRPKELRFARYALRSRTNVATVASLLPSLNCRPNLGSIRTVENDVRSCSFVSATMARCQTDLTKSFHNLGSLDVQYMD